MVLIDTNVLLDVLVEGAQYNEESASRLVEALKSGPLIVNDIIATELAPVFERAEGLWAALSDAEIRLVPYPREAAFVAGHAFRRYRRQRGTRIRVLPDFMIGAPAVSLGISLLTRDRGFYRAYFPNLKLF